MITHLRLGPTSLMANDASSSGMGLPLPMRVRESLASRLSAAIFVLGLGDRADVRASAADRAASSLLILIDFLRETPNRAGAWLTCVAVLGRYPSEEEVLDLARRVQTDDAVGVADSLITSHFTSLAARSTVELDIRSDSVVIDVDFSAKSEHNTGIQRVVRQLSPRLAQKHGVLLTAWADADSGLRLLTPAEFERLTAQVQINSSEGWTREYVEGPGDRLIVPWRSRLILSEVPAVERSPALAAIARLSGNRVSTIGYDTIPMTNRDHVNRREAVKFAKYLTVVKWADSVAAISAAAASEFVGFGQMLASQGLAGPRVVECSLPADPVRAIDGAGRVRERPLVVVVGSKEPRKNHVAVLFAAERLWREGLDFELFFVGSYGWDTRLFRAWLSRLKRAGRPVNAPAKVGDTELWRAYSEARFSVFPSLHEGYGLPVAESLAYGTPVITTGYGSTGEIAADGGCLTVDPRDDEQILDAMRSLLTDDVLLARLQAEALARPVKTWDDYAAQVWAVVGGSREG